MRRQAERSREVLWPDECAVDTGHGQDLLGVLDGWTFSIWMQTKISSLARLK